MLQCQYEAHISKNDTYSTDKPHFHEDIEIVLCIAGEGVFFVGSEVFPLFRGQLFLIDSSVLHRSVANEEYRCIAFHIGGLRAGGDAERAADSGTGKLLPRTCHPLRRAVWR